MTNSKFTSTDALKYGWKTFLKHPVLLFAIVITVQLIGRSPDLFNFLTHKHHPVYYWILKQVMYLINIIPTMGVTKICIKLYDDEKTEYLDLFRSYPLFFNALVGHILFILIIFGMGILVVIPWGILYFIFNLHNDLVKYGVLVILGIPAMIWSLRYCYYISLIVDKELGPVKALKRSKVITRGALIDIFLFSIMSIGPILILYKFPYLNALLITPIVLPATAYIYRKLQPRDEV